MTVMQARNIDMSGGWHSPLASTQLQEILESTQHNGIQRIALVDTAGHMQLVVDSPLSHFAHRQERDNDGLAVGGYAAGDYQEVSVPVVVRSSTVAMLQAAGSVLAPITLIDLTQQLADRLAAAWSNALEIESLAGEVVHAYEELHLLYELGAELGGQLPVSRAAEIILDKTLNTLRAEWAELSLDGPNAPVYIRLNTESVLHTDPAIIQIRDRDGQQVLRTQLRNGGYTIGSLALARQAADIAFSSVDEKLLDAVGSMAGGAIRNAQLYEQLRRLADTDALTGLANHRSIHEQLDNELAAAAQQGYRLGIMMVDIDDFKLFNDTYGHLVGDQILRLTSETLKDACRERDIVGRCGGDEFLILLPQADQAGVTMVAQRILDAIGKRGIKAGGHDSLPLALSIGFAVFPDNGVIKHDVLSHADAALYETKRRGGNSAGDQQEPFDLDGAAFTNPSTTFSVLQGLVNAVDAKDRYTREHSEAVTEGALLLAERLGLSPEARSALRIAGLLHDVGKIGIPDRILRKPGPLTPDEYAIMQQHVALSELIIKEVPHIVDVLSAVANHHERHDGHGYPRHLQGEEIPLLGRIMAIADACSAMMLTRPYRKGMTWVEVVTELRRGSGTQFDPALVEPFIEAMAVSVSRRRDR